MRRPSVAILYFEGCPSYPATRALVEQVVAELEVESAIELVRVPDDETAVKRRFLGSPTVRVDGRDVEPSAERRTNFALSCRVYPSEGGFSGQPDPQWIRDALARAAATEG